MDKNNYPSLRQEKTVCEKLRRAIQTTSPFRVIRFNSQIHDDATVVTSARSPNVSMTRKEHGAAAIATAASPNVALMNPTNLTDRCPRVIKQSAVRSSEHKNELPNHAVPIIFRQSGDHKGNQKPNGGANVAHTKPTVILPIHGIENRVPSLVHVGEISNVTESINGMFNEYIDRAGRKIRAPTIVGSRKPGMRDDSFNDKVSEFINRAKNKFHNTPSFVEASFKEEMRGKEKRLK